MAVVRLLARLRERGAALGELAVWASASGGLAGLSTQLLLRMSPVLHRLEHADRLRGRVGALALYEFHHDWTALSLAALSAVLYGALAVCVWRIA